ncbi:MAG: hypothetical protein EXQ88_04550 [Alphaproteobacteria bacterium]|nr:hypothetical protein [Alphaproteobacteria bacterium]
MRHVLTLLLAAGLLVSCAAPAPEPAPSPAPLGPVAVTVTPLPQTGMNLAVLAAAARAYRPAVFGSVETPLDLGRANLDGKIVQQWQRVQDWSKAHSAAWRDCAFDLATCRTVPERAWRDLLSRVRMLPREQQLAAVNRALNDVPYIDDALRDGVADYWATPEEFLLRSGDCEDFAIAKYLALRHLGYSAETLRIVILTDSIRGQVHAVLAVGNGDGAVILDSLSSELFADALYAHYEPHISVNELGMWEHFGRTVVPPLAELPPAPLG